MSTQSSDFKNKTIVITGAGGAFGRAASLYFASFGANICMLDANETFLSAAALEVQAVSDKSKVLSFVCDVRNMEEVTKIVGDIEASFKTIDYLFNNAGYQGMFEKTHNYSCEDFKKVFEINVFGSFNLLQACSRSMIKNKTKGAIVNVASEATSGAPNMIAYSSSKGAVLSMTKSASKDLAPYGIRVNCISPCFIGDNKMWERQCELQARCNSIYYSNDPTEVSKQMIDKVPIRRVGSVEEVISVTAFLLSDLSSYVVGQDMHINGGV
jgi:NAD(P)-dependent dehydrogenase (short-subunit alcohol dehydrogenase family)